jgi:hypothetical protein
LGDIQQVGWIKVDTVVFERAAYLARSSRGAYFDPMGLQAFG